MQLLSKQQILEANDRPYTDVDVPEWGGAVRVMPMTGTQREAWEFSMFGTDGKTMKRENTRAKLVVLCLVDEDGNQLFTESEIVALSGKSSAALDRVFEACQKACRIGADSVEAEVKNSNGDQSADSTFA